MKIAGLLPLKMYHLHPFKFWRSCVCMWGVERGGGKVRGCEECRHAWALVQTDLVLFCMLINLWNLKTRPSHGL